MRLLINTLLYLGRYIVDAETSICPDVKFNSLNRFRVGSSLERTHYCESFNGMFPSGIWPFLLRIWPVSFSWNTGINQRTWAHSKPWSSSRHFWITRWVPTGYVSFPFILKRCQVIYYLIILALQENIKRCVCIIYDPLRSSQGVLALKALKLSEGFMELYRAQNFTGEKWVYSIAASFTTWQSFCSTFLRANYLLGSTGLL